MPWLSILVPVYNVEPYLEECLTSLMNQIEQGVEILVLDDCSTDGSWDLMQKLAQRWPGKLQLMRHSKNSGLSTARNTMISAAQGDYLWFIDSDDKILFGALNKLKNIIKYHEPDVVLCDFSVWRKKTQLKHRLRREQHRHSFVGPSGKLVHDRAALLTGLLHAGQMHAWSKISKRSLWKDDLRFVPGHYFEDLMTMPLVALRCQSFYYYSKPWIAYRQRESSILSTMNVAKACDQASALRPLALSLENDSLRALPEVKFAQSQQSSRNFIGAMRFLNKQSTSLSLSQRQDLANKFRDDFKKYSPWSIQKLTREYLRRGWIFRAIKLNIWANWAPKK